MGSEASNKMSQEAARGSGENGSIGAGPEEFPRNEVFENAGAPGSLFGDKTERKMPSGGGDLTLGLSCRQTFHNEDIADELGMGRDESTGKPDGPEMGKVNNGGASAKLEWG